MFLIVSNWTDNHQSDNVGQLQDVERKGSPEAVQQRGTARRMLVQEHTLALHRYWWGHKGDVDVPCMTDPFIPLCNPCTSCTKCEGQPNFLNISQRTARGTESNALHRSKKIIARGVLCSRAVSRSCRAQKFISMVPRPDRNPYCDSGRTDSLNSRRRLRRIRAKIFPVIEIREIPR